MILFPFRKKPASPFVLLVACTQPLNSREPKMSVNSFAAWPPPGICNVTGFCRPEAVSGVPSGRNAVKVTDALVDVGLPTARPEKTLGLEITLGKFSTL